MKTFKQFIAEMPHLLDKLDKNKLDNSIKFPAGKHISTFKPTGHEIHRKRYFDIDGTPDEGSFTAVNPETNQVDMAIHGTYHGKTLHVHNLMGREGSTIKADDMYAHLANHHNMTIASDTLQSHGGAKVWKKLSERPDVEVHHEFDGKEIPLHRGKDWHKNYKKDYYSNFVVKGKK